MPSLGERPPELLRADREQIDRAAELLRGDEPAFVIVVSAAPLVPAALEHLRRQAGVAIPEPVVLRGSEEALRALIGAMPDMPAARVRSLALGGNAKEALRALNWHREKLLKGAPVVLWLDGIDGLRDLRDAAPDAYSFRDMVVLVRGDGGPVPQVPHKESRRILEARRRLARARTGLERAEAHAQLSNDLRIHGRLIEAENVARRGLEALPEDKYADESARVTKARLWSRVAMAADLRGSLARRRQAVRRGMDEIHGLTSESAQEVLVWLLDIAPGPIHSCDRASAERSFALARGLRSSPNARMQAVRSMSWIAAEIGDLKSARKLLGAFNAVGTDTIGLSFLLADQGEVERRAGRMLDAESYYQQATSVGKREGIIAASVAIAFAACWQERGELHVAEQVVRESVPESEPTCAVQRHGFFCLLELQKGELGSSQEHVHTCLRDAVRVGLDQAHFKACGLLAQIATEGSDADQLDSDALIKTAAELEVAEDISRALTDNDPPPWYTIRFLGFRADVLARTDRRADALDLARRALDLARATCPDLIPETGRALADLLLRAGMPDDALPVLAEVEPEAVERGMLKELACIRAARVLALVLRNEPLGAIEPAMTALREALESTGAPRIKAETLLDLAIRLPPTTSIPDPFALAGETHALFVEMPMPVKEARSLELAGDVLAARGKPADARRRYVTARGILERRGLGLRLPLLVTKSERLA